MSGSKQPAAVVVHGAYSTPDTYDDFLSALSHAGFISRCPHLPTSSNERPPRGYLEDDIAAVRKEVRELAEAGHPIIVIAHSWGGFVASESIDEDLCVSSFGKEKGGIVYIIYIGAWLLLPGDSVQIKFTNTNASSLTQLEANGDGTARVTNIEDSFYNDIVSVEERQNLASKHVLYHFVEAAKKATRTPWKDTPTTFVYCEKDLSIPLEMQKIMVTDVVGSMPPKSFAEARLDAGHFPFCSMPHEVVKIVKEVWATAQRTEQWEAPLLATSARSI